VISVARRRPVLSNRISSGFHMQDPPESSVLASDFSFFSFSHLFIRKHKKQKQNPYSTTERDAPALKRSVGLNNIDCTEEMM
jgi:hypothetical protein